MIRIRIFATWYLLITKGKVITIQWRNLADTPLIKQLTSPVIRLREPTDVMYCKGSNITSVIFLPKMYNLNPVMSKHQTKTNWGTFYKISGHTLQKYQGHERQILWSCPWLKEIKETWRVNVMWDPLLDPESEKRKLVGQFVKFI